jgi:hypothetical protein
LLFLHKVNIFFIFNQFSLSFSLWLNRHISVLFSINIKAGHCCEGSLKNNKRSLIVKLGFGGFSKKIKNKTFYFYTKKILHYYFILCFGPRVHFRGQKLTFYFYTKKKYCNIILYFVLALESISGVKSWLCAEITKFSIQSAHLSNYHISLWRKVFFFIYNQFVFINIKAGHCCEGSPKTIRIRSLIGKLGFGGFSKKIRNKNLFLSKKNKLFNIFGLVLDLESISRVKSWILKKDENSKKNWPLHCDAFIVTKQDSLR